MKEVIQVRRAAEGRKGLGLKPHETSLSLVDRLCQAQCDVGFLAARNNNVLPLLSGPIPGEFSI